MTHTLNKLSSAGLKAADRGKYSDGGGLWLYKPQEDGGKWVLRYTLHGRRHEMGLGRFPDVSLREAREAAEGWRANVRQGDDPIKRREAQRRDAARNMHLLKDIAFDAFESRKAELKRDGEAGRWFTPLKLHVLPKLGQMPVSEINQQDIRDTLAPIWHDKAETARKAINRLAICFRHAAALGLDVDLQATDKARALLGKQRHKVEHIPSLPWQEVPAFYRSLSGGTTAELALRLLILTGVRSGPLRAFHLSEIKGDIWTIPAENIKSRAGATSEFRVPLSTEARAVIAEASKVEREGYLFPGVRKGVISDMTMAALMKRRGMVERPHGFRTSFRVWTAEATNVPREVAETCLGHVTAGAVERAYRRTDFLEQRHMLMERWASHVIGESGSLLRLATK